MFGKNKIVGLAAYKNQPKDQLTLTSLFYTLQGEGPYRGEPAVFLRTTGCNRSCNFCDTYFDSGEDYTFDEIFTRIEKEVTTFHGDLEGRLDQLLIVMTGGEPMLQPNLSSFLQECVDKGFRTQIESNGDIFRHLPESTTLVISPKTSERTGIYKNLTVKNFQRANVLKFVVSSEEDSPYHVVPEYAHRFRKEKGVSSVFVSPMNMYNRLPIKVGKDGTIEQRSEVDERISFWEEGLLNRELNQKNHEYAAYLAMKYGFTLNLQTHLYASLP